MDAEALRREIHEGLNVVATNRLEDQKLSLLALHLLQACLVYINTLMLQRVLEEPAWFTQMTERDMRALSPLVYSHVSPYGTFDLDLEQRIDLGTALPTIPSGL